MKAKKQKELIWIVAICPKCECTFTDWAHEDFPNKVLFCPICFCEIQLN